MFRLITIAAFCTLSLLPIAGFASRVISNEVLHIAFTVVFGYVFLPAILLKYWPAPKPPAQQSMEEALAGGNVTTTLYSTVVVAELHEVEDDVRQFLVQIDGGRTLCLQGEYLYGLLERKVFPCSQFRAFAHRTSGLIYGLESVGPPIQSWPVYTEFDASAAVLVDGRIYDTTVAQLIDQMGGKRAVTSAA